jgi:hypothetical protein
VKRFIITILCLLFPLGLVGCSESGNEDSYLGTWVINKQVEGSPLGDFGNKDIKDIIGKKLSFSKKKASCFGDNIETLGESVNNPKYKKIDVTKADFERITGILFDSLGIKNGNITQIVVTKDPNRNTGIVFYVVDDKRLLVNGAGTFFLLKLYTKK